MAKRASLFGSNWDDPRTQGMLQAAAAMMQAGGPSRTPINFGQTLGQGLSAGLQGYQGQQQFMAQKKQNELQTKAAEMEIQAMAQQQRDAATTRNVLSQFYGQQGGQQSNWRPPMKSPTYGISEAGATKTPVWQQLQSLGEKFASAGQPDQAKAYFTLAEQKKPKLKEQRPVMVNGAVQLLNIYDDGTEALSTYAPADKLDIRSTGDKVQAFDPYTGLPKGQGTPVMPSPDSVATNQLGRDRLTFDQQQAALPKFTNGMFVTPPSATNPQGSAVRPPGIAGQMNDTQANANIFATRANEANRLITGLEGQYSPLAVSAKGAMPGFLSGVANMAISPESQKAEQAQRDFINAVLRKESGAAISESEFDNARKQYFPQVGDGPEVIEQKYQNRLLEIQGLKAAVGPGASFDVFQKDQPQATSSTFQQLPPAAQYEGRRMQADDGTIYRAVNGRWVRQ